MTTNNQSTIELIPLERSKTGRWAYEDKRGNIYIDCTKCHQIRRIEDFNKDRGKFRGVKGFCKSCDSKPFDNEWYSNNKLQVASFNKTYNRSKAIGEILKDRAK